MARYKIYGQVVGSKYLGEVEAESVEQAKEMGWKMAHVSVCNQCSKEVENPEIEDLTAEIFEDEQQTA